MQFSYEVGEHRIVLQVGKRKDRLGSPPISSEKFATE